MNGSITSLLRWFLILLFLLHVKSQFRNFTNQYIEMMRDNLDLLRGEIQSHPDVELDFYPDRANIFADSYRFDFPQVENYRINIIMDPCKGKDDPACCLNVFGTAEYPKLKLDGLEPERQNPKNVLSNDSDIQTNYDLVFEDGSSVPITSSRGADDELIIDYECDNERIPYSRCRGKNYAHRRSSHRPACIDNNQTIDVMKGCQTPVGEHLDYCVAIAYTQNSFIGLCGGEHEDNPHCGTFIEIHQVQGSPYSEENTKIAEVEITTRDVSGYYSTVLPLTWKDWEWSDNNGLKKVLCTYIEPFIRIGSSVYVTREGNTPTCCCMKPFKATTRVGSFRCPIGAGNSVGPFAKKYTTLKEEVENEPFQLAFPRCHSGLDEGDKFMCGLLDPDDSITYTAECPPVSYDSSTGYYSSSVLDGKEYVSQCAYFDSCATTADFDAQSGNGKCKGEDFIFTFIGRVGRVVLVDADKDPVEYEVTFNDGRTSYRFTEEQLKLEPGKSMYEAWWVVRTPSEFVVQKRKGFNISSPQCTYDTTNEQYFPYAILDSDGIPMDSPPELT